MAPSPRLPPHPSPAARDRHYLIIGPWDHAGTRTPNPQVGGPTFGEASVLDLNGLHKEEDPGRPLTPIPPVP